MHNHTDFNPSRWRYQKRVSEFRSQLTTALGTILSFFIFSQYSIIYAQTSSIPTIVSQCIPKSQVARSELVSTARFQGRDYYLLAAYEQSDNISGDLVISVINGACQRIFYNPMGDRVALSSKVSQAVARQLTLQRYQREIQRLGQQKFRQQVQQAAQNNVIWYAEEVWALRQLGISIPPNVRVNQ